MSITSKASKVCLGSIEVNKVFFGALEVYSSAVDGILDLFTTPYVAFSCRDLGKARSAFTSIGDTGTQSSDTWVAQIRRSSDDDQKSFTAAQMAGGDMETWVGANDGFITRWYDQSTNANHLVQSAVLSQPKIVTNGVRNADGLFFDGADSFMDLTSDLPFSDGTMHVVSKLDPTSQRQTVFGGAGNVYIPVGQGGATRSGAYLKSDVLTHHLNGQSVTILDTRGGSFDAWTSTSEQLLTLTGVASDFPVQEIGRGAGQTSSWDAKGFIQEVIFYVDDQSANRVGIETNINDHYSIF